MNVGAIGLVALGGLLMHAGFTGQSPLNDLKTIFQSGTPETVSPATVQAAINANGNEPAALKNNPTTPNTIASLANQLAAGAPNG